jgi:hypothetical protein
MEAVGKRKERSMRSRNVQWVQRSELRYNKSNQDIIEKSIS